ncbi:6352_t:CDS:1, partial [Diversispora eburnea]
MARIFFSSTETIENFNRLPLTRKEIEDAYWKQYERVVGLLLNPPCPMHMSIEELTQPSSKSRQSTRFANNLRKHPPRPLNPFIMFLKNFDKGYRKFFKGGCSKTISKLTQEEWDKSGSAVHNLFNELADLAKKYHQYKFPDYEYKPIKKER